MYIYIYMYCRLARCICRLARLRIYKRRSMRWLISSRRTTPQRALDLITHHFTSVHICIGIHQYISIHFSTHQYTSVTSVHTSTHQYTSVHLSAHQYTSVHISTHQYASVHISTHQYASVHISTHQ